MTYLLTGEETDRLSFRKVDLKDYDDWLVFHQTPNINQHWQGDFEAPEVECKKWYEYQFYRYENDLGGMNALIDKSTGSLVGHCGLLVQTVDDLSELEIGYALLPQYWRLGYAFEAAKKCRDHAFTNNLSDSVISIISITNTPSERVAIKNGMKVDKTTTYKSNKVNIFRITKDTWKQLK